MKISLTVPERLHTLAILPKESNFITLRLVRGIIEKIGYSPEEITEFEIKEDGGIVSWNDMGNTPKEIELIDAEVDIIKEQLRILNAENRLKMELFSVYEKIFG